MVKAKCNPFRIVIVGQNIYICLSRAVTLKLIIFWLGMEIVKVKRISEYVEYALEYYICCVFE
jgi:hypothetical protein